MRRQLRRIFRRANLGEVHAQKFRARPTKEPLRGRVDFQEAQGVWIDHPGRRGNRLEQIPISFLGFARFPEAGEELLINYNGEWNNETEIWFDVK
jgi:hypothetical protein